MKTIKQPVDIHVLVKAFKKARWKWYDGYPNYERMQLAVLGDLARLGEPDRFGHAVTGIESGGLRFSLKAGRKIVQIDEHLFKHYKPIRNRGGEE